MMDCQENRVVKNHYDLFLYTPHTLPTPLKPHTLTDVHRRTFHTGASCLLFHCRLPDGPLRRPSPEGCVRAPVPGGDRYLELARQTLKAPNWVIPTQIPQFRCGGVIYFAGTERIIFRSSSWRFDSGRLPKPRGSIM